MSKIVIRKRVSLDFLGDDYKEAYLNFNSIPVAELDNIRADMKKAPEDASLANFLLAYLKNAFIDGRFPNEKGELEALDSKDSLDGLDTESVFECWKQLTAQDFKAALNQAQGVILDPKS